MNTQWLSRYALNGTAKLDFLAFLARYIRLSSFSLSMVMLRGND